MKNSPVYLGAIIVAALGYFVDVYDLVLFNIVRTPSLREMGLAPQEIFTEGSKILRYQMIGMLLGGFIWGVAADKKGRSKVLLASILLYSSATFLNAFVSSPTQYLILRFISGIGLAGELGVGITLVAELMPQHSRGLGTTVIATTGVCGALAAALLAQYANWRWAYGIGGVLGFLLLLIRIRIAESELYTRSPSSFKGSLRLLFQSKERVMRYVKCVAVGLPTWYTIGVLVTFSPELAKERNIFGEVSAGSGIFYAYSGLVIGDLLSGLLSQKLQSRKKVLLLFLGLHIVTAALYLGAASIPASTFHLLALPLGIGAGYWAVFITTSSELFGTNLRATVATTIPNVVRGSTALFTLFFEWGRPVLGVYYSAISLGVLAVVLAIGAAAVLPESFHKNLDFSED